MRIRRTLRRRWRRALARSRRGYSLVEALMAMTLFAVGILALGQSYFSILNAHLNARQHELALQCARDRLEEMVNSPSYADISQASYPDEDYGEIPGGLYAAFRRDVSVADSLNILDQSMLKEVTVAVFWRSAGEERDVTLNTVVARYKDIQP